ncbi:unnamed protein product [Ceutorhynchus assimilis]|uniref:Glypican-6 n=1 Tax=Ceutorhynchus assimilis TaxID=467358 RepID=A0A9P0GQD6_9CUCU|nr:unnamed protein product [Ceutorhynchus assimilis]
MDVMRINCGKMCRLQGVVLFSVVCFIARAQAIPRSCDLIKNNLELRGFPSRNVLDVPQNGLICGEGSCCSDTLEDKTLLLYSQSYVEKYMKDAVLKVSTLVETRARKFDEIFRHMMNQSKFEFHDMFNRTYGKIYLQNAGVFSDFFYELETYYKKGTVRLSDTMDNFFGILYQKMFMVINSQYNFDDNYMICVNNHMLEMKPFGDVPHKLTQQLKRSFVATRTFYKSLSRAAETIRDVPNLRFDQDCLAQLTQMQMCGVCRGEMGAGACSRYCADTLSVCLRHYMQLSESWDNFVDAIEKVADRLIGPYNVDSVVEPLNIKISEAIMNFQEIGADVSQKIQAKCGSVGLKRVRRKAGYENPPEENPNMEIRYETMKLNSGKSKKHKKVQEKVDQTPTLDKLIEDIKLKIKNTKNFWIQLPYQYCNNDTISAGPSDDGKCWNGTTIGIYEKPKPKLDSTPTDTLITGQIYILSTLTDKLRKAYHGQDVEIVDDTEDSFDGSGSGSGDGMDEEDTPKENNEEDPVVIDESFSTPPPISSTFIPEVRRTSSSNTNSDMSLTRALLSYLLPMVMVWFGGAIKDLL